MNSSSFILLREDDWAMYKVCMNQKELTEKSSWNFQRGAGVCVHGDATKHPRQCIIVDIS